MDDKKNYKDKYQRKNMISICLNDDEYKKVETISESLNLRRASAVREILISNSDVILSKIKRNDNSDIRKELNYIGNNINQIAKKINTNIDLFTSGEAENFALSIDELHNKLSDILKRI